MTPVDSIVPSPVTRLVAVVLCIVVFGCNLDNQPMMNGPSQRHTSATLPSAQTTTETAKQSATATPLLSAAWSQADPRGIGGAWFGRSVSTAGDVNGDGFDDIIIGASHYTAAEGRAYVYHGASAGLASTPAWTTGAGSTFMPSYGDCVAGAGDVNADGYDDVIVGDRGADSQQGKAHLFLGSASGLASSPSWSSQGEPDYYGHVVAGAGDVNGDGFDDVLVTAPDTNGFLSSGRADERVYLYLGSATGLESTPAWSRGATPGPGQQGECFGWTVAGAGDIDADGYDDVVIGAPCYSDGNQLDDGRAYVFGGAPSGLGSSPMQRLTAYPPNAISGAFGRHVAAGGDLNGDGYADVLIGIGEVNNGGERVSLVVAYQGSPNGLLEPPLWSREKDPLDIDAEAIAGAGDIDGDGFEDIVVSGLDPDFVKVYHGSAGGPIHPPAWIEKSSFGAFFVWAVAGAGDVNGDGYDDLLIGAPQDGPNGEGMGHVYHGAPNPEPIAEPQSLIVDQDTSLDITLGGTDQHGDQLIFALAASPDHGALGGLDALTGEVTYTPDADYVGQDTFDFDVADPYGGTGTATVTIDVQLVNEAPTFVAPTPEGELSAREGEELSFVLAAEDPDGDELVYDVEPLPSGAVIDARTGEFSWAPTSGQVGSHRLTLAADDGHERVSRQVDVLVDAGVGEDAAGLPDADAGDGGADTSADASGGFDVIDEPVDDGPSVSSGSEGCGCNNTSGVPSSLMALLVFVGLAGLRVAWPSCKKSKLA